ncbi:MAG TPA: patatin-like phospholipase family protein [Acidimicrobiales bacterium]|nr:patatin-like phospholipase family protein [Acidimicrobiales bacterium]
MPVIGPEPHELIPLHISGPHPREVLDIAVTRAAARNRPALHRLPGGPTAFVFAGGANRGACQIGMLRALAERGIRPDLVTGTSVGAINAAAYVGQPSIEGVALAESVWRKIRAEDIFPKGVLHGSWRFLEKRDSVFPPTGLRKLIDSFLRFERIEDSPIPLTIVATRVPEAVEQWFTAGPAAEAIIASAALPAVFPVAEFEGERFVDGGVVNNVPLRPALAAGAKRIFVLLCGSVDHQVSLGRRPFEALLTAFDVALLARLKRDLEAVPDDVEVIVIEQPGLQAIDWEDFSHTAALIEEGYNEARLTLDRYELHRTATTAAAPLAHRRWWSRTPRP